MMEDDTYHFLKGILAFLKLDTLLFPKWCDTWRSEIRVKSYVFKNSDFCLTLDGDGRCLFEGSYHFLKRTLYHFWNGMTLEDPRSESKVMIRSENVVCAKHWTMTKDDERWLLGKWLAAYVVYFAPAGRSRQQFKVSASRQQRDTVRHFENTFACRYKSVEFSALNAFLY
jgi:hypothetical protein